MYHIAVDIGGTFTDCAVIDGTGAIATTSKSLSTPPDFSQGFLAALGDAADSLALTTEALLQKTELLIHGCTVATNAMIERKGVHTGLLTTRGHEDALFIGKVAQKVAGLSEREIIHQSALTKADPIIDRLDVVGIAERIDAAGDVIVALNEDQVIEAVDTLVGRGVEAIAIGFLWSFVRADHEARAKALVESHAPGLAVFTSHEVAPILGEYERVATTALSAYLGPRVVAYARDLETALSQNGFGRGLLYAHCLGGLTTLKDVENSPLLTLDSGPAGGVLGASYFARAYGRDNVICSDMGGTSFDVSVITGGTPTLDEEPVLDKYTFLIPKIAISTIGAGGGSIVWLDDDGLVRVGPQSAGAAPGPACYDLGGTEPTVTDANLVLGYLNPDNFLGGRMRLNRAAAEAALTPIAEALGGDISDVAAGAFRIVNAHMADLIRQATIERGHDPRNFSLFCYGGAGPTHSPFLGRELGISEVFVPSHATVFSALGMLTGGLVHAADVTQQAELPLSQAKVDDIAAAFDRLTAGLRDQFVSEGVDPARVAYSRFLHMKYRLQPNGLAVELTADVSLGDGAGLAQAFGAQYAQIYGDVAILHDMPIEVLKCRVVGRCATTAPDLRGSPADATTDAATASAGERAAHFHELGGFVSTPVFDGERLRVGDVMTGPCIVDQPGNALVIPPGMSAHVDSFLNIRITA